MIMTLIGLWAAGVSGMGQGQIGFLNTSSTLIATNSTPGGPSMGPISGPMGNYFFGLFIAPPGTTDPAAFTFTGLYGTNLTTAGRFSGGTPEVPGAPPDSLRSFLVRAWSANIGHDYSAVVDYLANPTFPVAYGESRIGTIQLGRGDPFPTPILFGVNPGQISGFTLEMYPVPEPSSVMVGVAAGLLWGFRMKKPAKALDDLRHRER